MNETPVATNGNPVTSTESNAGGQSPIASSANAPATSPHAPQPKKHHGKIILPIFLIIIVALFVIFLLNKTFFLDTFKGIGYNPTPDMAAIRDSLNLTSDGTRIFNATHPILASREDFNESCESHDETISVLGCYTGEQMTGDHLFIYNVDDPSLPGIRESTSAHELLHAVWARLSGLERNHLTPILESVLTEHADIQESLETYSADEKLSELYVRVGTQIADLHEELEAHYGKYFTDQDSIVAFYDSYITPFNELKDKIDTLKSELDTLRVKIESESASLDSRLTALESQIAEFNRCANTAGCFDNYTFYTRRSTLVAEQSAINAANEALNALINSYNSKVDEYNSSVLRSSELQNLINSNSPDTEEVIEE